MTVAPAIDVLNQAVDFDRYQIHCILLTTRTLVHSCHSFRKPHHQQAFEMSDRTSPTILPSRKDSQPESSSILNSLEKEGIAPILFQLQDVSNTGAKYYRTCELALTSSSSSSSSSQVYQNLRNIQLAREEDDELLEKNAAYLEVTSKLIQERAAEKPQATACPPILRRKSNPSHPILNLYSEHSEMTNLKSRGLKRRKYTDANKALRA